jgi:sugar O-acyltransferase (sialic acid O-acetyltransferase NeuD family)
MKDLIIAGAGGFGREALALAKTLNSIEPQWNIRGFINDVPDALDGVKCSHGIIGTIKDWQPSDNEVFVMGVSSPAGKEKIAGILKAKGARFVTLVHPLALVSEYVTMGEGCIINGRSSIGDNAVLGDFVNLAGSMVGQDAVIGDFSTLTGYVNITDAKLGKRVFVGSHAVILNRRKIGDDAYVCAGSIVFNNVKPGIKVFGNPAKKFDL